MFQSWSFYFQEPPNLNEILNNVSTNSPAGKDDDEDNDDDDDDDPEENDADGKKSSLVSVEINPERLKAFNVSNVLIYYYSLIKGSIV